MKKVLFIMIMLFAFCLVGCGPDGEDDNFIKLSKLEEYLEATNTKFENAEHGKFSIVATGSENFTFEMTYNYGIGKYDLESLKAVLDAGGNVSSCYVKEEVAYMLRDNTKLTAAVSSDEATTTINDYSYARYSESVLKMLGPSFWEHTKVTADKDGVATVTVDLSTYVISEEEDDQSIEFSDSIDKICETKKSFEVKFTYTSTSISKIEIKLVSKSDDAVSTITLSFIETSESEITIVYPNLTEYPAV